MFGLFCSVLFCWCLLVVMSFVLTGVLLCFISVFDFEKVTVVLNCSICLVLIVCFVVWVVLLCFVVFCFVGVYSWCGCLFRLSFCCVL